MVVALLAWTTPAVACCAALMEAAGDVAADATPPGAPPCHGPEPADDAPAPCEDGSCQCVLLGCQARPDLAEATLTGVVVPPTIGPMVALPAAVSQAMLPATYFDRRLSHDARGPAGPPLRTLVAQSCQLTL